MARKTIVVPLQVSKLLKIFCDEIKAILNGKFLALYIFGSLAMDDFSKHCSDIDFLVLIATHLSRVEGKRLQTMHDKLRLTPFGDGLEGEYVATSALYERGVRGPVARCEGGVLLFDVPSKFSAENILDIRQNAIVVYGPNPENVVPHVSWQCAKKVMRDYLREINDELRHGELKDLLKDLNWLSSEVLNTCRTLYTLKTGRIASKSVGARWALKVLSPEWKPLIKRSLAVRQGKGKEDDKAFIATALPRFLSYALRFSETATLAKEPE